MIEIEYDPQMDIVVLFLSKDEPTHGYTSTQLALNLAIDCGRNGKWARIAILQASKNLPKELIEHALRVKQMREEPRELSPGC